MATLGEIREAVFPAALPAAVARPASPAAAGDAGPADGPSPGYGDGDGPGPADAASPPDPQVSWVRVLRARVPAFDTLEPGDLVVVPSSALEVVAPTAGDIADLVVAFVRARVAGLLLVGEATDTDVRLGEAASDAGLPALRLAAAEPGTVERSVIGFLVNRRAELEHQAGLLEQRLERLALGATDLPGLVAEIGAFLGRAIALEGRRGDALAVHAPLSDPGAAAAVGRYLTGARSAALRVRLPGPGPGATDAGTLVLLGDRGPSELERITAERIAGLLALELAREEAVRRARDAARRAEAMPGAGPPWVVLVARQSAPGADPSVEQRETTRRELRLLAPARRMVLRGDAESLELRLVLSASDDPGALALAGRIAAFLGRPTAVSRPFAAPGDRPAAEAEARATLEAVEALAAIEPGSNPPPVARADRLPAYRLLGGLHNVPDGLRDARALLAPLLVGRPAAVSQRLDTLRAVLEMPGAAEAAAALGIHRNTLAYRIRRIEGVTGWRLVDPELRLPLAVAVRLVQSAQSVAAEKPSGRS
jgi:purine catabolism regulator